MREGDKERDVLPRLHSLQIIQKRISVRRNRVDVVIQRMQSFNTDDDEDHLLAVRFREITFDLVVAIDDYILKRSRICFDGDAMKLSVEFVFIHEVFKVI